MNAKTRQRCGMPLVMMSLCLSGLLGCSERLNEYRPSEAALTNSFPELAVAQSRFIGYWGDHDRNAIIYEYVNVRDLAVDWQGLLHQLSRTGWQIAGEPGGVIVWTKQGPARLGKRVTEVRLTLIGNHIIGALVDSIVPQHVDSLEKSSQRRWLNTVLFPRFDVIVDKTRQEEEERRKR